MMFAIPKKDVISVLNEQVDRRNTSDKLRALISNHIKLVGYNSSHLYYEVTNSQTNKTFNFGSCHKVEAF